VQQRKAQLLSQLLSETAGTDSEGHEQQPIHTISPETEVQQEPAQRAQAQLPALFKRQCERAGETLQEANRAYQEQVLPTTKSEPNLIPEQPANVSQQDFPSLPSPETQLPQYLLTPGSLPVQNPRHSANAEGQATFSFTQSESVQNPEQSPQPIIEPNVPVTQPDIDGLQSRGSLSQALTVPGSFPEAQSAVAQNTEQSTQLVFQPNVESVTQPDGLQPSGSLSQTPTAPGGFLQVHGHRASTSRMRAGPSAKALGKRPAVDEVS
jgi:hypothetical protein